LGIEHKVIRTQSKRHGKYFYNIYCFGDSDKYLCAHYDVVDVLSDNANDNSASVINCIAYKVQNPSINILLLDGEEPPFMGGGSSLAAKYLKRLGRPVKWILNLELTGVGTNFFIDSTKTPLQECIVKKFPEAHVIGTPFSDHIIFRQHGFASNVVTLVDDKDENVPDHGLSGWQWEQEVARIVKEWEKDFTTWGFDVRQEVKDILDQNWEEGKSPEETAEDILIILDHLDEKSQYPEPKVTVQRRPDMSVLGLSHSPADSVNNMKIEDMKNFVENVVDRIVKEC
jgi:hypothetical protein